MIKAENISKKFYETEVIRNFTECFNMGEFIAIKGESGSGKTTLLSIISTLMRPTSGKVYFNDIELTNLTENNLANFRNKYFGFVFQLSNMITHLKVWENVALPIAYSESPNIAKMKEMAFNCLKFVKMEGMFSRSVTTLSGGEQQRVAIARALINNPQIVFADEPTGNLDYKNTSIIMEFLKDQCNQGKCVIMVTHDDQIANKTDRVVYLSKYESKIINEH